MIIGAIADTHIDIWKKDKIFQHVIKMFDAFYQFCEKNNVDTVVHFGDLFHAKVSTSTEELIKITNVLAKFAEKWPVVDIAGNHDMTSFAENISLPQIFKGYQNIFIVDKYKMEYAHDDSVAIHYLPYYKDNKILKEIKKIQLVADHKNYLFSHFGVRSFVMTNDGSMNKYTDVFSSCSINDLKRFDKVYLGHYHGYQKKENVTYISSPMQMKHTDEHSKHGFVLIDTEKDTHKFYENKVTPYFCTIELTKSTFEEIKKLKNSYIRLIVPRKVSKEKLISLKDKLMKNNLDVRVDYKTDDTGKIAMVDGWDKVIRQDAEDIIVDFAGENEKEFKKKKWSKKNMLELVLKG